MALPASVTRTHAGGRARAASGRAGDARALAAGLRRLGESIGLDKKPAEEPQAAAAGDPALRLAGAMFVTGDAPGGPAGGKCARPAARVPR